MSFQAPMAILLMETVSSGGEWGVLLRSALPPTTLFSLMIWGARKKAGPQRGKNVGWGIRHVGGGTLPLAKS